MARAGTGLPHLIDFTTVKPAFLRTSACKQWRLTLRVVAFGRVETDGIRKAAVLTLSTLSSPAKLSLADILDQ
jgi:hypothetical protein